MQCKVCLVGVKFWGREYTRIWCGMWPYIHVCGRTYTMFGTDLNKKVLALWWYNDVPSYLNTEIPSKPSSSPYLDATFQCDARFAEYWWTYTCSPLISSAKMQLDGWHCPHKYKYYEMVCMYEQPTHTTIVVTIKQQEFITIYLWDRHVSPPMDLKDLSHLCPI